MKEAFSNALCSRLFVFVLVVLLTLQPARAESPSPLGGISGDVLLGLFKKQGELRLSDVHFEGGSNSASSLADDEGFAVLHHFDDILRHFVKTHSKLQLQPADAAADCADATTAASVLRRVACRMAALALRVGKSAEARANAAEHLLRVLHLLGPEKEGFQKDDVEKEGAGLVVAAPQHQCYIGQAALQMSVDVSASSSSLLREQGSDPRSGATLPVLAALAATALPMADDEGKLHSDSSLRVTSFRVHSLSGSQEGQVVVLSEGGGGGRGLPVFRFLDIETISWKYCRHRLLGVFIPSTSRCRVAFVLVHVCLLQQYSATSGAFTFARDDDDQEAGRGRLRGCAGAKRDEEASEALDDGIVIRDFPTLDSLLDSSRLDSTFYTFSNSLIAPPIALYAPLSKEHAERMKLADAKPLLSAPIDVSIWMCPFNDGMTSDDKSSLKFASSFSEGLVMQRRLVGFPLVVQSIEHDFARATSRRSHTFFLGVAVLLIVTMLALGLFMIAGPSFA